MENKYDDTLEVISQMANQLTMTGEVRIVDENGKTLTILIPKINASTDISNPSVFKYSIDNERNITACTSCDNFEETLMPTYGGDWWNESWKYRFVVYVDTGNYGKIIKQ